MTYLIIITIFIIITNIFLNTYFIIKDLDKSKFFVIGILICLTFFLIVTKISNYQKKNIKKDLYSVHITGKFGRGKTYKVMNNSFDKLANLYTGDDTCIKKRIKNTESLEEEYIVEHTRKDALYFSALGKTENELLSEINYELSFGATRHLNKALQIFSISKINTKNLFNDLANNRKNNKIDLIIIDDLERMSDSHHDIEINKIIRLIMQLQKKYNIVVITTLDTKVNTVIKSITPKNGDAEIEEFGNINFRIKFAKLKFTNFIYVEHDMTIVNNVREKYILEIANKIGKRTLSEDEAPAFHMVCSEQISGLKNEFLSGDLRSIELAYKGFSTEIDVLTDEELLSIIASKNLISLLQVYTDRFDLIYDPYNKKINEISTNVVHSNAKYFISQEENKNSLIYLDIEKILNGKSNL